MISFFCITVRFLQPYSHGRGDDGQPEWPPSPLRVFQAFVAASAARWNERMQLSYAVPALGWLERQPSPTIAAVGGTPSGNPYLLYIPNNATELVVPAWRKGDIGKAVKREQKVVRPMQLSGDEVHYLYPLSNDMSEFEKHRGTLRDAARSITHLGWGIDMVAANANVVSQDDVAKLRCHVWRPVPAGGNPLRVPIPGTLAALVHRHGRFLVRLAAEAFQPVPPLSTFATVGYDSATVLSAKPAAGRPFAAFSILKRDASGNRSFDTPRWARDVAAWIRHATGQLCEGWPFGDTAAFVHGHDENGKPLKGDGADRRFMYLPLPTINSTLNRVESIRRVVIAAPPGFQTQLDWVRRRLAGQELRNLDNQVVGLLNILPTSDWVLRQYLRESRAWSTVTPVIWPGHDDRDADKAEGLLRKAFLQAGLAPELVNTIEELDWRPVGFRAGLDLASCYLRPEKLNGRQYHVRVRFPHPIRGPLVIGAGRYRGLGLFAAEQ